MASPERHTTASPFLDARDTVGESIVWDDRSRRLVWVDIIGKRIHRLDPADGTHELWQAPDFPTSIGLRNDGGAIVGLMHDVRLWDFDAEWLDLATPEPEMPLNRLNEGAAAPDGSWWVASMRNNFLPDGTPLATTERTGAYHRIDPSGKTTLLLPPTHGIPNTMAWTDDGRFLTADTTTNEIRAHRIAADGGLADPEPFASGFPRGLPDGSCLDDEGFLWNCRVLGGACVVRFAPDGSVDRVINLPCSWPTSCTFGGPDLSTLYITSARFTMTPAHLAANPLEGALLAVSPGVRGRPCHRFGGTPADLPAA